MRKIGFLVIVTMFVLNSMVAQINVYHVSSGNKIPEKEGVFYSLPRALIKIDILIEEQQNLAGPLSEFAEKYFGYVDAIKFDFTTFSIGEAHISTISEPDPQQIYYIELAGKSSKKAQPLQITLSEAGGLIGIKSVEMVREEQKKLEKRVIVIEENANSSAVIPGFVPTGLVRSGVDTIIRRLTVDTSMVEKYFFRPRLTEKSKNEVATEIMNKIQEIRESKSKLLSGFQEVAYDAGTIRFMYQQLDKQEREYLDLFRGKSFSSSHQYTFYYLPGSVPEKDGVAIAKFSKNSGLTSVMSNTGEDVTLHLITDGLAEVTGNFNIAEPDEKEPRGIYYRISEIVTAVIKSENDEIGRQVITIPQFGKTKNLSAGNLEVELYPDNGNIKSVKLP